MATGFFLLGFICFILGINAYLKAEDTQWHKTLAMIKSLTDMQISDKFKTDNTLKTIISVVDEVRLGHAKEIIDLKLEADRDSEIIKSKLVEITSHLSHLRTENTKTYRLMEASAQDKSDEMMCLKNQADQVTSAIRGSGSTYKLPPRSKKKLIRARRSNASH